VTEPAWHCLRVCYHGRQDPLILDAVRPLFERIRPSVHRAYFLRHWRQGPHLRLNVEADAPTFAGVVVPAAHHLVGGYLSTHPSTEVLDPQALLPVHRRLAELEADTGPLLPWRPDNAVEEAPYDPPAVTLGPGAGALVADFYHRSTDAAFEAIDLMQRQARPRLQSAFDLMIATAHGLSRQGITGSFVSFRSHAEAFLSGFPEGRALRPAWDAHFARHAARLVERLRAVVAGIDGTGEVPPLVGSWLELMAPIREQARALVADGGLRLDELDGGGSSAAGSSDFAGLSEVSQFHRELESAQRWRRDMRHSPDFAVYRVILNCTYLHLTRLGLRPVERFLLCHLAADAAETAYGVSALEALR
jgi:Lantibiotic biosynthesis dehydratase C-term